MITIDTTNMCSHLQKKLFEENGIYHSLWIAMQDDPELTAVVRSRQLHIYRNGKKVILPLLVCPFGFAGGWSLEVPDIG